MENNLENAKKFLLDNNFEFFTESEQNVIGKTMVSYTDFHNSKQKEKVGYWFLNEHQNEVTVINVFGKWCVVEEEYKKKPYLLELEYVLSIKKESEEEKKV